jgi:hypothetical protein
MHTFSFHTWAYKHLDRLQLTLALIHKFYQVDLSQFWQWMCLSLCSTLRQNAVVTLYFNLHVFKQKRGIKQSTELHSSKDSPNSVCSSHNCECNSDLLPSVPHAELCHIFKQLITCTQCFCPAVWRSDMNIHLAFWVFILNQVSW